MAVIAWPVAVVWGHAEDALALALACYALLAVIDGRWVRCGWLLGLGVVIQPLVVLLLPIVIGTTPGGRRVRTMISASLPSVFLVGVALAGNPTQTIRAVIEQPTPASVNHATPWVYLAPHVADPSSQQFNRAGLVPAVGHSGGYAVRGPGNPVLVSGGVGRLIDVVLAVMVGLYVWRRPQPEERFVWLAAAMLASRCLFEAVMTPYYLAPPLILLLVLAARQGGKRFVAAAVVGLETTVFAYHHLNPWFWWATVVVGMGAVLLLSAPFPIVPHRKSDDQPSDELL